MRANEILSEISFGGKIPGLDEPILGQGSGAVVPGGAAMPAAVNAAAEAARVARQAQAAQTAQSQMVPFTKLVSAPAVTKPATQSAEAARVARQAQATQAAQSQMKSNPANPKVTFEPGAFEPRTPAVFRRPEGRTAGGFDPTKPPYSGAAPRRPETELDKLMKVKPPPNYTQTPSDAARAADAQKTLRARAAGATLGGAGVGIGAGAYLGSKEQPDPGTSTAAPPFNDGFKSEPAPGQAAASRAADAAIKAAPPRDKTQIDELAPALIPALAGLGAAGLAGTAAYQASKPSKPASVQPSSTAARPAAAAPPPAAAASRPTATTSRPAAAAPPPAAAASRPAATTSRPAAATTARPAGGPQQGVVGSELAKLSGGEFASRADRTNQAKVDAILGSGYKAGTAAANTALRDHFRQQAIRQELEKRAQDRVSGATVLTKPPEPLQRVEIPASGPAGSTSGGDSAPWDTSVPALDAKGSSSGNSSDNTVKSGTGLTWTDSSGNPIKFGVDETALQRLMTLSGQRH